MVCCQEANVLVRLASSWSRGVQIAPPIYSLHIPWDLPIHDGCPDSPPCPTCPGLRASKRHLPVWESKVTDILIRRGVLVVSSSRAACGQDGFTVVSGSTLRR